ncbi:Rv3235 family protein [Kribbella sp. NPDC050459]|uniref:Rv3235 family protein n=1 Tax=Kribbella sp. NPDC050459 TaxID=3155785 RepID=UPI0033DEA56F
MSQPHNLQPEDLPLDDVHPAAPLTAVPTPTTDTTDTAHTAGTAGAADARPKPTRTRDVHPAAPRTTVPTRTTDTAGARQDPTLTRPDTPEVQMAVTPTTPTTSTTPTARPAWAVAPAAVGTVGDARQMLAEVGRPRLASVGGDAHGVPATTRYADQLTDGALALRLEAVRRLGIASTPVSNEPSDADAPGVAGEREKGRKLSVVPEAAGATHAVAAPGQPDGAQAPLKTTAGAKATAAKTTSVKTTSAKTAGTTPTTTPGTTGGKETGAKVARPGGVPGREAPRLPEVRAWSARLAQAISEVLAGDRPISQLVRFADDAVFMELNRRVRLLGLNSTAGTRGAKEKSVVRSVRVFMPEPFIAEVAAHVRHGSRSRAVAFRLEVRRNRWVCTALELG